jgi:hypothetical protein
MSFSHKAGSESGIDYAVVGVMLLWVAAIIALVILLAVRSHADDHVRPFEPDMSFAPAVVICPEGNHGRVNV